MSPKGTANDRRAAVRRTVTVLAIVAVLIYAGFLLRGWLSA